PWSAACWIFAFAAALEISDWSPAFSSRRFVRWRARSSSRRLSCSTATLSATTPARRMAPTTIQSAPPATRRWCRADALGRGFGAAGTATVSWATTVISDLDRGAEPRRLRARVLGDLTRGRPDGAPMDRAQLGLVAAHADRELGRADAAAL